jgi:hypothetical protein
VIDWAGLNQNCSVLTRVFPSSSPPRGAVVPKHNHPPHHPHQPHVQRQYPTILQNLSDAPPTDHVLHQLIE